MVKALPYALTTIQKVKLELNITDNSSDDVIQMLINARTDFIENYCGTRRFLSTSYVEVKDTGYGSSVFMNHRPVTALASVEYRAGIPTAPVWMTYNANGYLPYFAAGFVRFFTRFRPVAQGLRLNYTAGYLIDFNNETDPTLHTLPFDLTQVTTELVAKDFNSRLSAGIAAESTEGQSITYESKRYELTNNHATVLNSYKLNRVVAG